MSEAALAPAPEVSAPEFDSSGLMDAISTHNEQQSSSQSPGPKPKGQDKPAEVKPSAEQKAPARRPWETKVDETPVEEVEKAAPESEPEVEEAPAHLDAKAKVAWGELRKSQKQLNELQPKYQAMEKELAELRSAQTKMSPEVEAELTELRQLRAAHAIETTPEWRESVMQPWEQHTQRLKDVADFAKVDVNPLLAIIDEPNRLQRNRMVREILGKSTEELSETDIQEAVSAINDLIPVDAKARELKKQSLDIQNGLQGREKAQSEQQKQAIQQKLDQASNEMLTQMKATFSAVKLFDNPEVAKLVQEARPVDVSDDPMMAAYQSQAGAILPAVIDMLNTERKAHAEARKILAARGKLSTQTNGAPVISSKEQEIDSETDLAQTLRREGHMR